MRNGKRFSLRLREDARGLLSTPKPVNYVRVPLAPLTTQVISHTVVRGGFGSRFVREDEAPGILTAQDEAAAQTRAGAAQPVRDKPPPVTPQAAPSVVPDGPVPFEPMVWDWVQERKLPNRTGRMMLSKVNRLVTYLKHADMGRVTQDDLIAYKKYLLDQSGLSHRTIKAHLDDLKTLFRFAAANRKIVDPTIGFKFTYRDDGRSKRRSYTPAECIQILAAARNSTNPVIRWCQWLAWATGARISEVAKASTKDICQIGGMWCIKILLDDREEEPR
jgi:hypothetical protein